MDKQDKQEITHELKFAMSEISERVELTYSLKAITKIETLK